MPTSTIALGQLVSAAFSDETTFGTPSAAAYTGFYYYKSSLFEDIPPDPDMVIGGDFQNFRDQRPAEPGLSTHGGDLTLPWCINGMGDWLKLCFGAPVTTNVSGSNNQHVFASGRAVLPTRTIEMKALSNDFRQHVSCFARSLKLAVKPDRGVQQVSLSLTGVGENLLTASVAASPASRAYRPVRAAGSAIYVDGAQVAVLLEGDVSYETGMEAERYVNASARVAAAVASGFAAGSGTLRMRYIGSAYDAYADANSDHTLEVRSTLDANSSLSFLWNAVRFGRGGARVDGPGGLEQSIPFRAALTASAPMLTVTLKNQITGY